MKFRVYWLVTLASAVLFLSKASAQQNADGVVNYLGLPEPLVMLLHDPEVQRGLALDAQGLRKLDALCDELDVDLWASRNKPADEANRLLARARATAEQRLPSILDARQQRRLKEIELWTLGLRALQRSDVSERMAITVDQRRQIDEITTATDRAVGDAMKEARAASPEARDEIGRRAEKLWKDGQKQLWEALTREQQTRLQQALGERFDTNKLGRIRMRAPELIAGDAWINSSPLTMPALRGRVVVLFYWTYG